MSKIKLLVLDENDEFHAAFEQYTSTIPVIDFLGVRTNVVESILAYTGEPPDIVLTASELIREHGDKLLEQTRAKWPSAKCYRLSVFDDSGYEEYASGGGYDGSVSRLQIEENLKEILHTFEDLEQT